MQMLVESEQNGKAVSRQAARTRLFYIQNMILARILHKSSFLFFPPGDTEKKEFTAQPDS